MTTDYNYFDSATDLGHLQLDCLSAILDEATTTFLEPIDILPGQRCLDLGAGSGSITRWLAERTGPDGAAIAVDLETGVLEGQPDIEVYDHDINDGLPVDGPLDLIHARLVLQHLPKREEILKNLAGALAPGGWLVLAEVADRPRPIWAPNEADVALFDRVVEHGVEITKAAGISYEWPDEVRIHLAAGGFTDIHTVRHRQSFAGGEPGGWLMRSYFGQMHDGLLARGLIEEELKDCSELMLDPRFHGWFFDVVQTRGRKSGRVAA